MNPPHYRGDVNHGMRFWELADVGPNAHDVTELMAAVDLALEDPSDLRDARESVTQRVYPIRKVAALKAASTLEDWAGVRAAVGSGAA